MTAVPTPADREIVPIAVLTRAQRAVLGQLTEDGASDLEIADRLGLAEQTVKAHMKAIFKATGCRNRTALVVACLRGRLSIRTVTSRTSELLPPLPEAAA